MTVHAGKMGRTGWRRAALDCTDQVIRSIRSRWLPTVAPAAAPAPAARRLSFLPESLESRRMMAGNPVINEFMALNQNVRADKDGEFSDWIELHNPTPSAINLNGYHLTDEDELLEKWELPSVTLPAGGYLLLFASGKDIRTGSELHTNFSLDGAGEYLALVAPDGVTVLSEYAPEYPEQVQDVSYGLSGGGSVDTPLVHYGSSAKYTVPSGPVADWNQPAFNDAGWTNANVGIGFEVNTGGTLLPSERESNDSSASANDATSNFQPFASSLFHLGLKGNISTTTDGDFYRIGALNTGDVLTIAVSGSTGQRGSLANSRVELFRGNANNPTQVVSDDDTGPGADALVNRFGITANDTYYVRVSGVNVTGTYDLALHLVNAGAAPGTGGGVTAEVEANDTAATATDASTSWRAVQYRSRTTGTAASTADWFKYQLRAGDLVTVELDAVGTMDARVRLLSGAVTVGYDNGTAGVPAPAGNDAYLYGFVVPTTGTYYVVVDKASGSGSPSYALNVQLSSQQEPPHPPLYADAIATNVQSAMHGVNASAYLRVPFTVGDVDEVDMLELRMRYDDGFIAYLNGVEVARRNFTGAAGFDSAASAENSGIAFEAFDLTAFTGALVPGNNILAIQALNAGAADADLLVLPELIATRLVPAGEPQYFTTPTPGTQNVPGALGLVADTKFSHDRGFYTQPFALTITSATPGVEIRYTLDGTPPTAGNGLLYTGPVTINKTTTLRAAAFRAGFIPSDVDTQTYLFLDDVLQQSPNGQPMPGWPATWGSNVVDYGMDPDIVNHPTYGPQLKSALRSIPSFSVTMDLDDLFDPGSGIYANPSGDGRAWERPASLELIYPNGKEGFQSNAGIRIRGGFSRSTGNPKHGFRFLFRDEYGNGKLNFPLFGADAAQSFDGFDLRTFQNYSWSFQGDARGIFMRDQLSRDAQLAMGHNAERGDYYHLYINGVYWGIYNTAERPEASYGESYFGGDKDDYDVIKHDSTRSVATDGDTFAWNELWSQASAGLESNEAYYRIQGRNADGTINPALDNLVDVENLIDYMLVIYYGGNLDAPISAFMGNNGVNNFYAVRSRVANEGFRFFAHDSEHTYLNVNEDRTGPWPAGETIDKNNPQWIFQQMWANAEFRLKVADHVHRHFFNGGALSPTAVSQRFLRRRSEIETAVHAESARWGDSKRANNPLTHADWLIEVNNVHNNYIPARSGIVLQQLRNKNLYPGVAAPAFNQHGGIINPGFQLTMTAPAGTIYYTLDGSDPRLLGGGLAPGALVYSGPLAVDETTQVRSRVLHDGVWSAVNEAFFSTNLTTLRVSEVMYHPLAPQAGSPYTTEDFEYLELVNTGNGPMRLTGAEFTAGIVFNFGDVRLEPGERALLVSNRAAFESRYGTGLNIIGEYDEALGNGGDQLRIRSGSGHSILDFTYSDDWYDHTDGEGYSLVAINPAASTVTYGQKANWRPSAFVLGRPGEADPGFNPGQIAINEVMALAPDGGGDWIEIHNSSDGPADISGWFLSDDSVDRKRYVFPANTVIPANGYLVLHEDETFGRAGNPGVATPFTLDHAGEALYLSGTDGAGNIAGYREKEDFANAEPGVTFGRLTKPTGADFVPQVSPTPGALNSGPRIGPVVINEILYVPAQGMAEFIELRNITAEPVALYDPANPANTWKFTRGVTFGFPQGATVPANGYALVVPIDPDLFRSMYQVHRGVPIFGPYTGELENSGGENIELSRPGVPGAGGAVPYHAVDRIAYETSTPWPQVTALGGNAIVRRVSTKYGNDSTNWAAEILRGSQPGHSPGHDNLDGFSPTVDITDVSPDPIGAGPDAITITFSEIVQGFDLADLTLTRDGVAVPLGSATLTSADDVTWVLGNLSGLTGPEGDYTLTLAANNSGIRDLAKRNMATNASETFTVSGTVISGTDGDDTVHLRRSGENVLVWLNADTSLPPTQVLPIDPFGSILVSLLDGNDTLVLDLTGGGIPLPDGSAIDGGGGEDDVRVFGTTAAPGAIAVSDALLSIGSIDLGQSGVDRVRLILPGGPALNLAGSARVAIDRTGAFRTGALTVAGGVRFDIGESALIVEATPETRDAVAAQVVSLVRSAREADPRWSGNGLTSSALAGEPFKTIAAMLNPGFTRFGGEDVTANDVLVHVTYNGDANADGRVNSDDYFRIDSGFLAQPAGPTYNHGDFNYDGLINSDDYFLIDSAFLGQATPLAAVDATGAGSAAPAAPVAPAAVPLDDETSTRKKSRTVARGDVFQTRRRVSAARRSR